MDATVELVSREQAREKDTWDLGGLFPSNAAWEEGLRALEPRLREYESFRGALEESPARLKACLQFDMEFSRDLEKVYTYAHLRTDEDKTQAEHLGNYERAMRLLTQYQQARSFINAELAAIPEDTMDGFLRDPELAFFKLHLERQLRYRPHTLSEKEESILASASELGRLPSQAFGMLDNADMTFGEVKDADGQAVLITQGNFMSLMQRPDRELRKAAFHKFYEAYAGRRHTFTALLSGSVKKDLFFAKTRRFPSVCKQALFAENIPMEVYDNLIAAVHNRLEPLHRYFSLRRKVLNLDALHLYDTHVPLVASQRWHMGFEAAVETIGEALAPLGGEYTGIMKKGLLGDRWVDRYENKGKRSGAYSSGCYDSNPFILMNYMDDNINSVYTLAHEAGHSMHSFFSKSAQPYLYADYTIFVAEVASTFNEALLTRHLLGGDIDRDMRVYLLCREIDNFRGTLYRQTMFAEFEHLFYAAAERGEPLTTEMFQNTYRGLLELYFGPEVVLDPCLDLECLRIPHFYFGFYVYKYATGISAAYALAERVMNGGPAEREAYLNFLKGGGSKFPIDLLRDAGVDMRSPAPVERALDTFADLVNQLETLAG